MEVAGELSAHDDGWDKGGDSSLDESGCDVREPAEVLVVLSFRGRELVRWRQVREIVPVRAVDLHVNVAVKIKADGQHGSSVSARQ